MNKEALLELFKEKVNNDFNDILKPHEKKKIIDKFINEELNQLSKPVSKYDFNIKGKIHSAQRPRLGKGRRIYAPDGHIKDSIRKQVEEIISNNYSDVNFLDYTHIEVSILSCFKPNTNLTKFEKVLHKLGLRYVIKKPDVDNIAKIYLDSCNGLLWEDDAHIIKLTIEKVYSEEDEFKMTVTYK